MPTILQTMHNVNMTKGDHQYSEVCQRIEFPMQITKICHITHVSIMAKSKRIFNTFSVNNKMLH